MEHAARQLLLQAMGYSLLQRRTQGAMVEVTATPSRPAQPATAPMPRNAAAPPAAALWGALLKAAGTSAEHVARLGWECTEHGPPFAFVGAQLRLNLAALRGDPPAKRALWKTLRPLRRQQLGSRP